MTSQEFGALIRARREAKGLSVEELAGRFKLSARTLHAIENGVLDGMPHAVYARGFVRAYAQSTGVEPDDVDAGIEALFPRAQLEDVPPMPGPIDRQRASSQKQYRGGDRLVAMVLILVLLVLPVLAGWFVITRYGSDIMDLIKRPLSASSNASMPETPAPQPVASSAAPRASVSPAQTASAQPGGLAATPLASPSSVNATAAAPVARNATTAVAPAAVETAAAEAAPVSGNRVSVEARAECYVQAMADGEGARTMHVYPGQTSIFPFKKKLVLVLGNGGGVTLRYNGKPYPLNSKEGERVSLTFPPR